MDNHQSPQADDKTKSTQQEQPTSQGDSSGVPTQAGPSVAIYTTPTCGYCKAAKEFFTENGVEYAEHNVAEDSEKRQEMITRSGQMGVPVIFVGDEMVIGFNEDKLRELLSL